jgi:hypothetical protein
MHLSCMKKQKPLSHISWYHVGGSLHETLFSSYHAIWCLLRYRQPCSCIHCMQWEQITYPFLLVCAIRYSFIGMTCLNSIYWTYGQNQLYFRISWITNKTNDVSGVGLDFTSLMLRRRNTTSAGFTLPCCMFCSIYFFIRGPYRPDVLIYRKTRV